MIVYERLCDVLNIYRGIEDLIAFPCYAKPAECTSGKLVAIYEPAYRHTADYRVTIRFEKLMKIREVC